MANQSRLSLKKVLTYIVIVGLAVVSAVNYQLFIFPNRFAPAGLNGLCTMIQYVFGISVSSMNLMINIPLAMLVYFKVSRSIAVRSMTFVLTFSAALTLLEYIDLSAFAYATDTGTSTILGPLVAGIVNGSVYSQLAQGGAYTGGTDFVAALIRKNRPGLNFFGVIFILNAVVAFISYFVYGFQIEPVILCIIYCFMSSTVSDKVVKSGRQAIRFEIITENPKEISEAIITRLHHSATLIPAKGMYSGRETNVLICVINKAQVSVLASIVRSYPHTFAVMSSVNEVMGNFKQINNEGKESNNLLDTGDTSAV
jgi:uncharacterized membrane-anchored protein YitT (DUF2179 family)